MTEVATTITAETMARAVARFYAGESAGGIATSLNVSRNVIAGRFERAGIVRTVEPRLSPAQFDAAASRAFAARVRGGMTPKAAGEAVGRIERVSIKHAEILNLYGERGPITVCMVGGAEVRIEPADESRDAEHVATILSQGGFDRCDFETGWVVGIDGALRYPFTKAAAEAARAMIADAKAQPWSDRAA